MKKYFIFFAMLIMSLDVFAVTAPSSVFISVSRDGAWIAVDGYARHNDMSSIDGVEFLIEEYTTLENCSANNNWETAALTYNPEKTSSTSIHGLFPNLFSAYDKTESEGKCYRTCTDDCGIVTDYSRVRMKARAYTVFWAFINGVLVPVYTYSSYTTSNTLYQGTHFTDCQYNGCD